MFDFDAVVGARHAETGGGFQAPAGEAFIELGERGFSRSN